MSRVDMSPLVFSSHLPCPYPQPRPLFLAFRLAFSPMDGRIERNLHDVGPIFQHPAFPNASDEGKYTWHAANRSTNRHVDEPHYGHAIRRRWRQPKLTRQAILEANLGKFGHQRGDLGYTLNKSMSLMIGYRPVHHAISRIRYRASLEPLDEGAQPVFELLHTGYPVVPQGNCTWEKRTRFISSTSYQSILPCVQANSLLCLHWLMIFLFIQVRIYQRRDDQRAGEWSTEVDVSSSLPFSHSHPLLSCHPKSMHHASFLRSQFIYAVLHS